MTHLAPLSDKAAARHVIPAHGKSVLSSPKPDAIKDAIQGTGQAVQAREVRLDLHVVTQTQDLEALEREWNALFTEHALPHHHFLSFAWNWHWHESYVRPQASGCNARLCLVVGRAAGRLVLIWPLARETRFGFTQITFMGDPVTQYGDVLVERGPLSNLWLKQAYDFVCHRLEADAIFLRKVRADANLAPLLASEQATITARQQAPYIDLSRFATYEEYFTTFGRKARKNRRRHRRRMAESGEISYSFHGTGKTAAEIAAQAVGLKRLWLESRGLFSRAYATHAIDHFFKAACGSHDRPTGAYITQWCVAGKTAAIEVGFEHRGHHVAHIGVYHPDFERHSPGTLQMEDTIRSCIDRGLQCYDLMAPADPYKLQWCDSAVEVCDYALPASPLGQIYVALYLKALRRTGKRFLAALPKGPRRLLAAIAARIVRHRG